MALTLLLILYSVIVQGIVLPGKCPSVPPTNFPWTHHAQIKHQISVPFISHKSHIFNSSMAPFALSTITYFESEGVYRLAGKDFDLGSHVEGNISKSTNRNGSNQMTSDIIFDSISKLKCQDTITEEVRLWIDNSTLILWSCVDDGHGTEHDEAALVFDYYERMPGKFVRPDVLVVMKAMNVSARKYLSDTFLDTIDWSRDPTNKSIRPYLHVPDECLAKGTAVKALRKSMKRKAKKPTSSYYWVCIFPIVFLALLCSVSWFNREDPEEESPTENQPRVVRQAWESES